MCIGLKQERGRVVYRERACVREEGRAVIRASPLRARSVSSDYLVCARGVFACMLGNNNFLALTANKEDSFPETWDAACALFRSKKNNTNYYMKFAR